MLGGSKRQPGWREAGVPLFREKRKEEGKTEREKEMPQQECFGINREGVQERTQDLNAKGNPVCDSVRLCEEAAQSLVVKLFLGG